MSMLLIDGDILLYRAISSAEQEFEFETDVFVMYSDLADARQTFNTMLKGITDKAGCDKVNLCLTDETNWRKSVYPEYKANRKSLRKPMGFTEFKQWVIDNNDCISKPTLEADDVLGILATKPGNDSVIWSVDKDLMQIPGKHLIEGKIQTVTKLDAELVHLRQTLTGDVIDGYPGCPGMGAAKAKKLFDKALEGTDWETLGATVYAWPSIVEAYEKAGLTEADALVQARVARICQWDDWDSKAQQVKLWEAPKYDQ